MTPALQIPVSTEEIVQTPGPEAGTSVHASKDSRAKIVRIRLVAVEFAKQRAEQFDIQKIHSSHTHTTREFSYLLVKS